MKVRYDAGATTIATRPTRVVGLPAGAHHELGIFAFAVALRRLGVDVVYLGADLPTDAWTAALTAHTARCVVIGVPRRPDARTASTLAKALANHGLTVCVGGSHQDDVEAATRLGHAVGPAAAEVSTLPAMVTGLVREARDIIRSGTPHAARLSDACGGDPDALEGGDVTKVAEEGDPAAAELIHELGVWIGEGAASLAAILDPAAIVAIVLAVAAVLFPPAAAGILPPLVAAVGGVLMLALAGGAHAYLRVRPDFAARTRIERVILGLLLGASLIAILTTAGIVLSMLFETGHFFQQYPWQDFLFGTTWSPRFGGGSQLGILPLVWGTLYISLIALAVSIPIGDDLFQAMILMLRHRVHRVVVRGTDGGIAGVLSQLDLMSFVANHSHLIAMQAADATDVETLMTCADAAMYLAKRQGGNRVVVAPSNDHRPLARHARRERHDAISPQS